MKPNDPHPNPGPTHEKLGGTDPDGVEQTALDGDEGGGGGYGRPRPIEEDKPFEEKPLDD